MTDTQADLTERARALVERWEHGSEEHRQWLRDMCVPDVAAFAQSEREAAEKALQRVADALGVDCISDDSKSVFIDGHGDREVDEYIAHIKEAAAAEARRAAIEECARLFDPPMSSNDKWSASSISAAIRALASPTAPQEETR